MSENREKKDHHSLPEPGVTSSKQLRHINSRVQLTEIHNDIKIEKIGG